MGLLKFITGFAVGLYAGVYLVQHYNVPNVSDPVSIYNKALETLEKYKKDKPDD